MSEPIYHLRPNKSVDRNLFIESLIHLSRLYDLSKYRYIGFGSYEFDEFKLVYQRLGLNDLHSIEIDTNIYKRQLFNKPYSCIHLYNKSCSAYFDEDYLDDKKSIIWLDFSEANKKYEQCQDIASVCSKMQKGDILRITMNANHSGIATGKPNSEIRPENIKKERYLAIKECLNEYFPEGFTENDISKNGYPKLLLQAIRKAVYHGLDKNLSACPLCSYVYSDNTQMLTITIIICTTEERTDTIINLNNIFHDWEQYVKIDVWDIPIRIILPSLTVHEQLEICQYEKDEISLRKFEEKIGIDHNEIEQYLLFARYYPNYQPITI